MPDYSLAKCDSESVTVRSVARPADSVGIYRRGDIYWLNFQTKGVRHFVSLETQDYAEAIERAREIRIRPKLTSSRPFLQEIESFLAYKRHKNQFTTASAHGRFYILRAFANWVDVPPGFVTTKQIQAYYNEKLEQFNAETANSYYMILRSFFRWAVDVARVLRRNPCNNVDLVDTDFRGRRLKDFCSETERDRLIKSCTREDLAFVLYAGFHAGLRKNEIIEARPWWFDLSAGKLHLRETPTINSRTAKSAASRSPANFRNS